MKLSENFVLISLLAFKTSVWALPVSGSATASSVATATPTGAMSTKNTSTTVVAAAVTQKPEATPSSRVTTKATSTPGSAPINRSTNYRKHARLNGRAAAAPPTRGAMDAAGNRPSRGRNYVTSKAGGTSGPSSRGSMGGRTLRSKRWAARKQDSLHGSQIAQKKVTGKTANRRVVSKPPANTTSSRPSGPKPTAVSANKNGGTTSGRGSASVVKKANPSPVSNVAATSNATAKASAPGKATTTSVPRVSSIPKPASTTGAPPKSTTTSHRPTATLAGSAAVRPPAATTQASKVHAPQASGHPYRHHDGWRRPYRSNGYRRPVFGGYHDRSPAYRPYGRRRSSWKSWDRGDRHRFSSHKGEFEGGQQATTTQAPISTATPTPTQTQ